MGVGFEVEVKSIFVEDNYKDIEGFIFFVFRFFDDMERLEGSEVVGWEEFDFFMCFLSDNVFDGKGMNIESFVDVGDFFFSCVVDVKLLDIIRFVFG